ncbi:hypothetical protein F0M21_13690 [Bacillus velezensis]|uniref:Uncharacterized protein n=1 Tax=Bacillus velezensis (strain DSM 23117 / BGSC 10A6 / LMG 26770 / FZB42) TaxID=326423 RepID=A7Z7P7_BACVZ|nr:MULTISPECIES: hypothetical protein [Bacillus]ABS75023.2 hypothetical protein RBAM_026650 [Bacillus velezensis FZB42]AGZ57471.1 hypothetical protein U471_27730 [Bacillus amyloliquefaciens CC178]MBG9699211.1 hypothetical protein [Bacillus amyloliquefaciens]KSV99707.1 hypothetical protein AR441_11760 [Bacillus velezensis]OOI01758.1 hypothetical protein BM734_13185 [Bacillus velezensis]
MSNKSSFHKLISTVRQNDFFQNKCGEKTLTVPKWLAEAAEKEGVNFSQLLQFALRERLGINKRSKNTACLS